MIDLDNLEWQQKRKIASALIHPQYKKSGENNLAMLKVSFVFKKKSKRLQKEPVQHKKTSHFLKYHIPFFLIFE